MKRRQLHWSKTQRNHSRDCESKIHPQYKENIFLERQDWIPCLSPVCTLCSKCKSVLVSEVEFSHEMMSIMFIDVPKCQELQLNTSAALDARKTHLDKLTLPDIGFQYLPSLRANHKSKWHMSLKDPSRVPDASNSNEVDWFAYNRLAHSSGKHQRRWTHQIPCRFCAKTYPNHVWETKVQDQALGGFLSKEV